jgi:hypothetical protein
LAEEEGFAEDGLGVALLFHPRVEIGPEGGETRGVARIGGEVAQFEGSAARS